MITQRPLPEMTPRIPPRALVIEAPKIKHFWGPFFRARYGSPRPHTIWKIVLLVPFTKTKWSIQLEFVKFDR